MNEGYVAQIRFQKSKNIRIKELGNFEQQF